MKFKRKIYSRPVEMPRCTITLLKHKTGTSIANYFFRVSKYDIFHVWSSMHKHYGNTRYSWVPDTTFHFINDIESTFSLPSCPGCAIIEFLALKFLFYTDQSKQQFVTHPSHSQHAWKQWARYFRRVYDRSAWKLNERSLNFKTVVCNHMGYHGTKR
jgi:hypothetical protein